VLLLSLSLAAGCSEETKSNKSAGTVKKSKPQAKSAAPQAVNETEEVEERPTFVYSPTGRRDPFQPLVTKEKKVRDEKVPLTPLQRFDLGQFRLQAVLIGKGAPRAMVSAPDGKTYILSPGIKIGKRDGVVTEITREAVLVEEVDYDVSGTGSKIVSTIAMPEPKLF
jgi:type IV pilus assembly protein PilP